MAVVGERVLEDVRVLEILVDLPPGGGFRVLLVPVLEDVDVGFVDLFFS